MWVAESVNPSNAIKVLVRKVMIGFQARASNGSKYFPNFANCLQCNYLLSGGRRPSLTNYKNPAFRVQSAQIF